MIRSHETCVSSGLIILFLLLCLLDSFLPLQAPLLQPEYLVLHILISNGLVLLLWKSHQHLIVLVLSDCLFQSHLVPLVRPVPPHGLHQLLRGREEVAGAVVALLVLLLENLSLQASPCRHVDLSLDIYLGQEQLL